MQIIITDCWPVRARVIHLGGVAVWLLAAALTVAALLASAAMYHGVVLYGARAGWPVVSSVLRWVARDELDTRDRYVRQNIDLLARRVGEMQAQLAQIESLSERVSALAGMPMAPASAAASGGASSPARPGAGGALVQAQALTLDDLDRVVASLLQGGRDELAQLSGVESRLFERKLQTLRLPTQYPVDTLEIGSRFGWRVDPVSGVQALHTGLDFPAPLGTPIHAAAGGLVVIQAYHPEYGNMVEVDHGQGLVTRYAHASRVWVRQGALVRKGEKIAEVGTSGRSTGPHLHFELLVGGVFQDPARLLKLPPVVLASASAVTPTVGSRR